MRTILYFLILFTLPTFGQVSSDTLTVAFGSCNNHKKTQSFWKSILDYHPNYWFWGGDNVYADTDNMDKLHKIYHDLKQDSFYATFAKETTILGTWDDHDYGLNDGGAEFSKKKESKIEFMRFMNFDDTISQSLTNHPGIYYATTIKQKNLTIKAIFLDSRTFRSPLKQSTIKNQRYDATDSGTMLGSEQWDWLQNELVDDDVDLFILSSSIQVISEEHGYEKWANFPREKEKLLRLISDKPVIILSGDRHIGEFSLVPHAYFPLYDITASGLTHTWSINNFEPNRYRIGSYHAVLNFGLLNIFKDATGVHTIADLLSLENNDILERVHILFPY